MQQQKIYQGASFALALGALFLVLRFGLMPGLLAALAAFAITSKMGESKLYQKAGSKAHSLAATVVIITPLVALTLAGVEISQFLTTAAHSFAGLSDHLVTVASDWRDKLPGAIASHIPEERGALQAWLGQAVQSQMPMLAGMGKTWAHGLLFVLVGIIVGALAAASKVVPSDKPLATEIRMRAHSLYQSFVQIVVAQFWIATINTGFTAVFLFGALPLFDVNIPYSGWLVLLTFVAGMLPIVGNLLCNVVLTLAGLGVGPHVAIACLVFLIAVHKLEYVINAKVVGSRISTAAWELIVAMFVFESIFGVVGLVAAPLYYAYLKLDMKHFGWI